MTPYDLTDYHALIRRIREIDRAGGDSTLARLVTADWLQEKGYEAVAEWMRLRIEDRGESTMSWPEVFGPYAPLCQKLRDAGRDRQDVKIQLVLGTVGRVKSTLAWWLAHGPDLCRRHPVRDVTIADGVTYAGGRWFLADGLRYVPQLDPFLVGSRRHSTNHHSWPTEEEAVASTNAAALRWAESEADKPTL